MKFLVLGCNGMAGHMISLHLKEAGHAVEGFSKEKSNYIDSFVGDATDIEQLTAVIHKGQYDAVINCIGLLNNFAESDKALAVSLNSFLPHALVKITKGTDTQVIHMSTDCVFSGVRGGYREDDFPDGTTFYDRSKALGEINDEKNITLRNSIIGPDINKNGIGLMNWFMQQKGEVNGYLGAIWTGQTTLQLAKTMEYVAQRRAYGLYNAVPDESISKYELLCLMNKYFRGGKIKINPIEGISANKSLVRTNHTCDFAIPTYEVMIRDMADWLIQHKEMYPHYDLSDVRVNV